MSEDHDVLDSCGTGDILEDINDTNGFSEHELLDIMYTTCNTRITGEVLASTITQYLQTLTVQNPDQDRLDSLQQLLDPERHDPHVSRETFHSIMKEWIAQCHQNSSEAGSCHVSWPSGIPVNGLDFSCSQMKTTSSAIQRCSCAEQNLSDTVAELKHVNHELREQNSSLLRILDQSEDVNLQLSLEMTELEAKLVSAQRSSIRARSLAEDLEETRQMLTEAQQRASLTQRNSTKLTNDIEHLKIHNRRLEDTNRKLTFERSLTEESLNDLRRLNAELRADHQETLLTLKLRNREITQRAVIMEKMKNAHMENHIMIEGLQSELMRLQEHSHQILLSYDRQVVRPRSLHCSDSLQSEMRDVQQEHDGALDDVQSLSHRIRTEEMTHQLHSKHLQRDSSAAQRRPPLHCQQRRSTIKHQFFNAQQELCTSVWEEKEEKVEEQQKNWEKEQKQSQTGNQSPTQEAKKVAVVNWWRAHSVEEVKSCTNVLQELKEKPSKPLQAEDATSEMRKQVHHLQVSLGTRQEHEEQKHTGAAPHTDEDTKRQEADTTVEKDQQDTEPGSEAQLQGTRCGLLVTLGRIETMVSNALETAQLVRQSEQRVIQVRQKMESITQKVEPADNADEQLDSLEARISQENPPQSPVLPADPGSATTGSVEDVEPEETNRAELPPDFPEVTVPPRRPMNGATGQGSSSSEQRILLESEKQTKPT